MPLLTVNGNESTPVKPAPGWYVKVPSAFMATLPPCAVAIVPGWAVSVPPLGSLELERTVPDVLVHGRAGEVPTPNAVLPTAPVKLTEPTTGPRRMLIVLSPSLVTTAVLSSAVTTTASGVGPTPRVLTTALVEPSITLTVPSPELAARTSPCDGRSATPKGCDPTVTVCVTAGCAGVGVVDDADCARAGPRGGVGHITGGPVDDEVRREGADGRASLLSGRRVAEVDDVGEPVAAVVDVQMCPVAVGGHARWVGRGRVRERERDRPHDDPGHRIHHADGVRQEVGDIDPRADLNDAFGIGPDPHRLGDGVGGGVDDAEGGAAEVRYV